MNDLLFACKSPFSEQLQPFCPAPTGQRSVAHHRGDPATPWREEYIVERPKISITRLYSAKDYAVKGKKIDGEHTRFATIDRGKDD